MNLLRSFFVAALLLAPLAHHLSATGSPPERMSYQGYLVDANGVPLGTDDAGAPLPANYDVVFRIYSASSGGTLLWAEQQTITVDNGYFSVLLGEGTPNDSEPNGPLSAVFTGIGADERFVGVAVRFEVGGEFTNILPRLRLLASPYAFLASQARSVVNPDGQTLISAAGSDVIVDGTLTTTQPFTAPTILASGENLTDINASNISAGTLDANRIPSLAASKIGSGVFSTARIPNLNASVITAGTLNIAHLDNTVVRTNREQAFTSVQRFRGNAHLDDQVLYIRGGSDTNHGLAYSSSAGSGGFPYTGIDGPLLWGNLGGGLGVSSHDSVSYSIPLRWTHSRVEVHGTLQVLGVGFATSGFYAGSSRGLKEKLEIVDPHWTLERLRELPITEWNYIEGEEARHIGPMAEDFREAFGLGINNTSISVSDMSGVALLCIKALDTVVRDQESEIAVLRAKNAASRAENAEIRAALAELQATVSALVEAQNSGL